MGRSLLSVSVVADGPFPLPSLPWHFQHSMRSKILEPRVTLSAVLEGSAGISSAGCGFSAVHRGQKSLTYASRSARSCAVSAFHDGMLLAKRPRPIVANTSFSRGKRSEEHT